MIDPRIILTIVCFLVAISVPLFLMIAVKKRQEQHKRDNLVKH